MNTEILAGSSLWCPCQAGLRVCSGLPSLSLRSAEGLVGGSVSAGVCGGPGPLFLHSTPTLNSQQQLQELLPPWG